MANRRVLVNWGGGGYPRDGDVNLSDDVKDVQREQVRVNQFAPGSSSTHLLEKNCFPLSKCRYFDIDNGQMAMDGCITLADAVDRKFNDFFESLVGGAQNLIFTMKMRRIVAILLAGYNILSQKKLWYSRGEFPQSIVFRESDKKFEYPVLTDYLEEKSDFETTNRPHNYAYLKALLERLIGRTRRFSPIVISFLGLLTVAQPDYGFCRNHPALWMQDGGLKFANQACSYIRQCHLEKSPELHIGNPYHWKKDLTGNGLSLFNRALNRGQGFLDRQLKKEGRRGGDAKFSYSNNEYGKLRLMRDLYAHEKDKTLDSIDGVFEMSFPGFNSRIYNMLKRLNFVFEEKASWEEELPSLEDFNGPR